MEKTIYENESTPKADGFHMPGEHEPQERIWMLWPHRTDNWQYGAKPAQQVFADVARAIAHFEPVTIGVKPVDYAPQAAAGRKVEAPVDNTAQEHLVQVETTKHE